MAEQQLSPAHQSVRLRAREPRRCHYAKRAFDILISAVALLLVLPFALLIAVAIKLDSNGPVLYRAPRLGGRRVRAPDGPDEWVVRPFTLWKFRTMVADADQGAHQRYITAYIEGDEDYLRSLNGDYAEGESVRPTHDPRITRVGAVLRKLSFDEIPQLWNVLRGDMSLVGPRPPIPYETDLYEERHFDRFSTLPGITGWAQVNGRCSISFEDMVRMDVEYIRRRSVLFDFMILLLTVPVVLSRKGAG